MSLYSTRTQFAKLAETFAEREAGYAHEHFKVIPPPCARQVADAQRAIVALAARDERPQTPVVGHLAGPVRVHVLKLRDVQPRQLSLRLQYARS